MRVAVQVAAPATESSGAPAGSEACRNGDVAHWDDVSPLVPFSHPIGWSRGGGCRCGGSCGGNHERCSGNHESCSGGKLACGPGSWTLSVGPPDGDVAGPNVSSGGSLFERLPGEAAIETEGDDAAAEEETEPGGGSAIPVNWCCCVEDVHFESGFPPGTSNQEKEKRTPMGECHQPFHFAIRRTARADAGGPCKLEWMEALGTAESAKPGGYEHWNPFDWNNALLHTERGRESAQSFAGMKPAGDDTFNMSDSPCVPSPHSALVFFKVTSGCQREDCRTCCALALITSSGIALKGPSCEGECARPALASGMPFAFVNTFSAFEKSQIGGGNTTFIPK